MQWIERVNRYFLNVIEKFQPRGASGNALLHLSIDVIDPLVRLHLSSHDEFIGETLILLGSLADGRLVMISEADTDWVEVCEALDRSGRLSSDLNTAKLQLLADTERKSICLLDCN